MHLIHLNVFLYKNGVWSLRSSIRILNLSHGSCVVVNALWPSQQAAGRACELVYTLLSRLLMSRLPADCSEAAEPAVILNELLIIEEYYLAVSSDGKELVFGLWRVFSDISVWISVSALMAGSQQPLSAQLQLLILRSRKQKHVCDAPNLTCEDLCMCFTDLSFPHAVQRLVCLISFLCCSNKDREKKRNGLNATHTYTCTCRHAEATFTSADSVWEKYK